MRWLFLWLYIYTKAMTLTTDCFIRYSCNDDISNYKKINKNKTTRNTLSLYI